MRDLRILIENTKASFTNIIQEIEDRISGIEDSIEKKWIHESKKVLNLKIHWHETSRKSGLN